VAPPEAPLAGPWTLAEGIGVVFLNLGLNLAVAVAVGTGFVPDGGSESAQALRLGALTLTPYLLTMGVVLLLLRRHSYSLSQGLGIRGTDIGLAAALVVGAAFLARGFASVWTGMMVVAGFDPPANLDVTTWFPTTALGLTLMIIMAVVVAPIVEETIYRGILFPALRPHVGRRLAVLLSALAFGLAHVSLVWLLVPTAFLGILLALAFEKTRSLSVAIAGHALFNLLAVVALLALRAAGVQ